MANTITAKRLPVFFEAIKFSHSVFALPFALIAMMLASRGLPSLWDFFWIIVACVAARTAAMTCNRLADLPYDSQNPRTRQRALVTGELSKVFMAKMLAASSIVFIIAALMLNTTCFILSVPVLAVLLGYSYTKQFTSYSHYFLGAALGLAPLGAWIAVRESFEATPLLLSLAVLLWVAGFDILYSCQDHEIDLENDELHSLPKKLGVEDAMMAARRTHAGAVIVMLLFWWSAGLGLLSLLGIGGMALLLRHQHRLVSPRDLSRMDAAFFTTNGMISIGFFVIVFFDVLFV